MSHTAGPWKLDHRGRKGLFIVGPSRWVARLIGASKADARLMAAAPELLGQLRAAYDRMEEMESAIHAFMEAQTESEDVEAAAYRRLVDLVGWTAGHALPMDGGEVSA